MVSTTAQARTAQRGGRRYDARVPVAKTDQDLALGLRIIFSPKNFQLGRYTTQFAALFFTLQREEPAGLILAGSFRWPKLAIPFRADAFCDCACGRELPWCGASHPV